MSLLSLLLLLVASLCLVWIAGQLFWRARRRSHIPKPDDAGSSSVRDRLAEGKAGLERIAHERDDRKDPDLGKVAEDRIVWRELIELELQQLDEEVGRIRETAGLPANGRPNGPTERDRRST